MLRDYVFFFGMVVSTGCMSCFCNVYPLAWLLHKSVFGCNRMNNQMPPSLVLANSSAICHALFLLACSEKGLRNHGQTFIFQIRYSSFVVGVCTCSLYGMTQSAPLVQGTLILFYIFLHILL